MAGEKSQPARTRRRAPNTGNWRAASTFITFPSQSSAATASVAVLFGGHRRRRYFVRLGRMRQLAVRMTPPRADDIQDKTPAPPPRRRHLGLSHASSCCVFVSPAPWKSAKKRKQGHCCVARGLPPLLHRWRDKPCAWAAHIRPRHTNSDRRHFVAPWHTFRAVETFT